MSATRRASPASSFEQQPANRCAGCRSTGQGQVHAHHLVAGVDHTGGGHRRIDATAHRGEHPHRSPPPTRWPARPARPLHRRGQHPQRGVDVGLGAGVPQRQPQRAAARGGIGPIASSTCDGCATRPCMPNRWNTSIPLASNNISSESPSQPRKVKWALPGNRCSPRAPLRCASSTEPTTPSISRSRRASRAAVIQGLDRDIGRRGHPDHPATSGVPERTSRSCPPPCSSGTQAVSRRSSNAPHPGGTAELVGGHAHRRQPRRGEADRDLADGLDGVAVHRGPRIRPRSRASSAIGMMVPTSQPRGDTRAPFPSVDGHDDPRYEGRRIPEGKPRPPSSLRWRRGTSGSGGVIGGTPDRHDL